MNAGTLRVVKYYHLLVSVEFAELGPVSKIRERRIGLCNPSSNSTRKMDWSVGETVAVSPRRMFDLAF
jgi:hypothetical protein